MISGIDDVSVGPNDTLRHTIGVLDSNRRQFALVIDGSKRLLGLVTDGDIRRALLRGSTVESPTAEVMNPHPRTAPDTATNQQLFEMMADASVRHMPVVTSGGIVTGFATLDEYVTPEILSTPVVLMAGGKGQRLYPLTKDVPKPMLPVGGTPIIGIILERIRTLGFRDVRISVNYLAEIIEEYVGDGSRFGLRVQYIHETHPLGTAGALGALQGAISEPFLVMNADLITHVDLRDLVDFHNKHDAEATVGVREHVIEVPFGVVNVENSFVTGLTEKPLHRSMVSAGIYCLSPATLDRLTADEYCDMPTLLTQVMESGHNVAAFPIHESWLDVGRPEDLSRARDEATGPGAS
jgi:dTDP-glucose pyrophosphorylase